MEIVPHDKKWLNMKYPQRDLQAYAPPGREPGLTNARYHRFASLRALASPMRPHAAQAAAGCRIFIVDPRSRPARGYLGVRVCVLHEGHPKGRWLGGVACPARTGQDICAVGIACREATESATGAQAHWCRGRSVGLRMWSRALLYCSPELWWRSRAEC
jgi:hypothetical protein